MQSSAGKRYYPLHLDLAGKICVVVGGGRVAERKVNTLLQYGAAVVLVSPEISEKLSELVSEITWHKRSYRKGDLEKAFLAYSATDDNAINRQVYEEARHRNILVNVVDVPDLCNFIVPSIVSRGDLSLSVSTGGKSPALSKKIRKELEKSYGGEYADYLILLGNIREFVKSSGREIGIRRKIFEELAACSDLLPMVAGNRHRELLKTVNGILARYGLELPEENEFLNYSD
ncbi:MAG: bifunctional precorrin-2 dehydrogenase/sirohydrochlorin ferrochelatase [bacterium]